jgi:hypothetical protein
LFAAGLTALALGAGVLVVTGLVVGRVGASNCGLAVIDGAVDAVTAIERRDGVIETVGVVCAVQFRVADETDIVAHVEVKECAVGIFFAPAEFHVGDGIQG